MPSSRSPLLSHPEIPPGPYCYTFAGGPNPTTGAMPIAPCPHFQRQVVNGVSLPWCALLQQGSVPNGLTVEQDAKLTQVWGKDPLEESTFNIPEKFSLFLLWDACKECGHHEEIDFQADLLVIRGFGILADDGPRKRPLWFAVKRTLPFGAQVAAGLRQLRSLQQRYQAACGRVLVSLEFEPAAPLLLSTATEGDMATAWWPPACALRPRPARCPIRCVIGAPNVAFRRADARERKRPPVSRRPSPNRGSGRESPPPSHTTTTTRNCSTALIAAIRRLRGGAK